MSAITLEELKSITPEQRNEIKEENYAVALEEAFEKINYALKLYSDLVTSDSEQLNIHTAPLQKVVQYGRVGKEVYETYSKIGLDVRYYPNTCVFAIIRLVKPVENENNMAVVENTSEEKTEIAQA